MLEARAASYDTMAATYAAVTNAERLAADNSAVRRCNNFVKACVLDAAARAGAGGGLVVVDIACGRGQDVPKWKYAAAAAGVKVARYYGMDLSELDVQAAKLQAARFLEPAGCEAVFSTGDAGVATWDHIPTGCAHVVSCQLALHYFCARPEHMEHFMAEVRRVLVPTGGGLALLSFTDGRSVVRHARVVAAGGCSSATIIPVRKRLFQLQVPADTARLALPSPWGLPYVFSMEGAVAAVPEYLCHEGATMQVATRVAGLRPVWSRAFDVAAMELAGLPRFREVARKMGGCGLGESGDDRDLETLEVAALYRVVVLAPSPATGARFKAALST